METKIESSTWLYVIIVVSAKSEQLLGQIDYEKNVSFIPVFKTKAAAENGFDFLSKEADKDYEVQAIIYEDLIEYTSKRNFLIFIIDEKGTIENCVTP